jgi:hypothetical protein
VMGGVKWEVCGRNRVAFRIFEQWYNLNTTLESSVMNFDSRAVCVV